MKKHYPEIPEKNNINPYPKQNTIKETVRVPTLHFQIPCVFPVQLQIFPVPIYLICDYDKTDLADLFIFWE